ncbi:MAG: hypothetical protein V8S24_11225 [Gordonibacter pamelaeae]
MEPEVRHHHRRRRKLLEFTHSSTRATMLMLAAAVAALVIENTPVLPYFAAFWHDFDLGFSLGASRRTCRSSISSTTSSWPYSSCWWAWR